MGSKFKNFKSLIRMIVKLSRKSRAGKYINNQILSLAMEESINVTHNGIKLKFSTPNALCHWRAKTFSTKEPETLEWIDSFQEGSTLWDIGANIGLYSIYAAKKKKCSIWAFEPSVFNLESLSRNIDMNELSEQICIIPLALSDSLGKNHFRMTTTEWGGALSTFGKGFGWDGNAIKQIFKFQILGISMDDAFDRLNIHKPDYIKMDVDGLEHYILKGGQKVLGYVKGILIEVNDDFHEHADLCSTLLKDAGLVLKEKRHSEYFDNNTNGYQNCYNQIWTRS